MKFKHEIKEDNILVLTLSGDLIGEDNGASILELATDHYEVECYFQCS